MGERGKRQTLVPSWQGRGNSYYYTSPVPIACYCYYSQRCSAWHCYVAASTCLHIPSVSYFSPWECLRPVWLTEAHNVAHLRISSAVAMWTVSFLFLLQVVGCILSDNGEKVEGGLALTCIHARTRGGVSGSLKAAQSCGEFNAHVFPGSVQQLQW